MAQNRVREEPPKLNMDHGFVNSIIKNQVDRDEYDKEQKLLNIQKEDKVATRERQRKERRAAQQVYIPPHQRNKMAVPVSDPTQDKKLLLQIEFEGKDGLVSHLNVYEDEDLKATVKHFAAHNNLDSRLREALYQRILHELTSL